MNNSFLSEKLLFKTIPLLFFIILILKIFYVYATFEKKEREFVKNNSIITSNIINEYSKHLREDSLSKNGSFIISKNSNILKEFSNNNDLNIQIKVTSKNPLNQDNKANFNEKNILEYFNRNTLIDDYFALLEENGKKYYYYSTPIKSNLNCIKCHIDVKESQTLAILSIKTPNNMTKKYFIDSIIFDLIYDFTILIIIFILIQYTLKNIKNYKLNLQEDLNNQIESVDKKNSKLNAFYKSFIVYHMDINGAITFVNDNLSKISGYSKEELIGKNHRILFDKNVDSCIFGDMWETILAKKEWTKVVKWQTKDNKPYFTKTTIVPIFETSNTFKEFMIIQNSVTSFIEQKEKIKSILQTDNLTKLPNRTKLLKDISKAKNPKLALINIDKFKEINDFYGYRVGDLLLIEVAEIIREMVDSSNIKVYRLASDEFGVFQDCSDSFEIFIEFISLLIKQLEAHKFELSNQQISINVSSGVSKSKYDTLSTADMALNKSKLEKKTLSIYNSSMNIEEEIKKNLSGVAVVKNAIKNDKIVPFFQPIYNVKEDCIDRYETLARLISSDKISLPNSFIYYAKRAKLYPFVTKMILQKSFKKFKELDNKDIGFSVNISIQDVKNKEVVDLIKYELSKYNNPKRVVFEILESEGLENYTEIKQFINDIKSYGAKIAIDDFGSGYSNFSHLLKLNIDYLKIDSSLIKNIKNDLKSKILLESIVYFSKKLNIKTVAEYVEDEESLNELKNLGIDFMQGYYIGKPKEDLV